MTETLGVILAGGLARRMGGGDKCFRPLAGRVVLDWIVERAGAQCSPLIINANGDAARFDKYGLAVIADEVEGFAGPLAGILAAMDWCRLNHPDITWIASFPADAPFIPMDFVSRCREAAGARSAELVTAKSGGRTHPVCGLWNVTLADDLRRALIDEDIRKIDLWTARYNLAEVAFEIDPFDPFYNINQAEDLAEAEEIAKRLV
ncbi:MAG: molybdenum cofactor guanylyltransferase MobA [Rhodospirillales bacterium]|nr:molybdenum cofactor guanylyltransferase MobA [Rhodospirillales bacterium]